MPLTEDVAIPISLVSHFAFCPRRAWLESVGEKTDSAQVQTGTRDHTRVDDHKTAPKDEARAVDIFHKEWGVTGRLDVLKLGEGICTVREYKATPIRRSVEVTAAMRTQLALQVACLNFMGIAPVNAEIYFTTHNRVVPVELDASDFTRAQELVVETRKTIDSDHAPEPLEDSPRCMRCSHAGICLPDERKHTAQARRIIVSDPDAQVVHLTVPGSRASLRAGQLLLQKQDEVLAKIPIGIIQGVQVHGNIDVSGALIRELMWRDIPLAWCSGTGRMYGWAQSSYGPNGRQRVLQHVASFEGRLALSREFIGCKIANQKTKLRRVGAAPSTIDELRRLQKRVSTAETWQEIIGFEGEAASVYFSYWPLLIKESLRPEWPWTGRSGRPATDATNALLNYGYSMLTNEAVKALVSCGLDPHAGFLHSSNRNKPALALDLMEEFRAPIVDSVVQTVINNGEVTPKQFSNSMGTWRMEQAARKSLIATYERRMSTEIRHPIFCYSASWRRTLEIQARQIMGFLDGTQSTYQGIKIR